MKELLKMFLIGGAVIGWALLLSIGGCGFLPHFLYKHLDREIVRVTSPDGKRDAVVLSHYAPPYAAGYYSLSIVNAGKAHNDEQVVFSARNLRYSKIEWESPRVIRILHPAFEAIHRYYPIWTNDFRYNEEPEKVSVRLIVEYDMDSLEKWYEKHGPTVNATSFPNKPKSEPWKASH